MKNFTLLLLSGLLLATIIVTQTLDRYATDVMPVLKLFSERTGIWKTARDQNEPDEDALRSWLLSENTRIVREANGVVHIQAKNESDAYIAWGYALARDRFFQLQYLLKMSQGRLSEMFGPEAVAADVSMLNLSLDVAVAREVERMSEDEYALLRSFSNGINFYIANTPVEEYPLEVRVLNLPIQYWRPQDCLRIIKLWEYLNSFSVEDLERQVISKSLESAGLYADIFDVPPSSIPENDPGIDPMEMLRVLQAAQTERDRWLSRAPSGFRDYAFTVKPERMQRGNAIHAGFTASQLLYPNFTFEVQITTPRMNAYGFSLVGAPFMVSGFTPALAWNFTRPGASSIKYLYAAIDSPDLPVQTSQHSWVDRAGEQRNVVTYHTRLGPVFKSTTSDVFTRWTVFESSGSVGFFKDLLYVSNADSVMDRIPLPTLAAVLHLTDRRGRTREQALYPDVSESRHGLARLSATHLKTASGPAAQPGTISSKERFARLIDSKPKHSLDDILSYTRDMALASGDVKKVMMLGIRDLREKEWAEIGADLSNWNLQANIDSKIAPLVSGFTSLMRKYVWDEFYDVVPDGLPPDRVWIELALSRPNHPIFDSRKTSRVETAQDIIVMALQDALKLNVIEYGPYNSWSWGEINKATPLYFLAPRIGKVYDINPVAQGGFSTTVVPVPSKNAAFGFTQLLVVEFRAPSVSAYVCNMSINPSLPSDGMVQNAADLWAKRQYRAVRFQSETNPVDGKLLELNPYGS